MKIDTFFVNNVGSFKFQIIAQSESDVTFIVLDCPKKKDIGTTQTVPAKVYECAKRDFLASSISY